MASIKQKPILVSACLLGLDTRYDGCCKKNNSVINFLSEQESIIIPVCPEQLAGFSTPRPATQFSSGDGGSILSGAGTVVNRENKICNEAFIKGAEQVLAVARMNHCNQAIFKERSPSCGVHQVYRNDLLVDGSGVTTALLKKQGILVFSENELDQLRSLLSTEDQR